MVSCVIFDFDGTIADSIEVIFSVVSDLAPQYGYPRLTSEDRVWIREHTYGDMIKKFKISAIQIPFFIARSRSEFKKRMDQVKIHPGMRECLMQLSGAGLTIGIVTSNVRENVEQFITQHSLSEYISFVETDPTLLFKHRVIKKALNKRALDLSTAVYIGDEIRDIQASMKAGIGFVGVDWGLNTGASLYANGAKQVWSTPSELSSYLLRSV